MGSVVHKTVPLQVWVDIDERVVDWVRYLNAIPGVRTTSSCQGTIGEGGPEPYPAYVGIMWADDTVLAKLREKFDVIVSGECWGYLHRRENEISPSQDEEGGG